MNTILLRIRIKRTDFNRGALSLFLIGILFLAGCGMPGDPVVDDLYTQNVYPGTTDTYNVGSDTYTYEEGWLNNLSVKESFALVGDARVYQQKTMPIQIGRIVGPGKPTIVTQGIFQGFSLPIWNGGANVDEQLFTCQCAALDWDSVSDMRVYIGGWLSQAENNKKFNLQLSWEYWTAGDAVPLTTIDVEVETDTGVAVQFTSFKIPFDIDYDTRIPVVVETGDAIGFRLRRIAATANEIGGEVVVEGFVLVYRIDKLGGGMP